MTAAMEGDLREEDLDGILTAFYAAVETDPLLAGYFLPVDMHEHMPRIVAFWSTMVFDTGAYTGNAFRPHLALAGLTAAHFGRWLEIFEATVDERAAGSRASRMKALAHRIAYSMQIRLKIVPVEGWRALE